ncbi:MAG TPA: S9 family peptidase, partial [Fimbriimonadaceae bacterium]|nr:S9 family peptidase [Fimbriimonadaceae bacterium]
TKKHINDKNKYITNLYTVDIDGKVQQWTQGEGGAGHGRWSADGSQIAFISGRDKPSSQIYILSATGGEARKGTSLPEGSIGDFKWSPDGKLIAFTFREQHPDWTEKAKKEREEKGLSTPPREIDDIWYRLDGDGYFLGQRFAIYILEVATGEHRKLYDKAPMGMYDFDWSPDSKELAVVHSAAKRPMFDPANEQIYRIDLDGQAWQLEGLPKGSKTSIRWSPDGRHFAYLGHVDDEDPWGVRNNRLFVVSAEGGEAKCLTPDDDYCLTVSTLSDAKDATDDATLVWSPDSRALYVTVGWHGEVQLGFVELDKPGSVNLLTKGNHTVNVGTLSRNGERFGCVHGTATRPLEVALYDLTKHQDEPQELTKFNAEFLEEIKVMEPEEIWLDSEGGKLHCWVIKPVDYLEPRRYPAVLEIHGGPHTQYGWAFFHEFQLLAAQGYVVVYSNPRGSKGYGEDHTAAIRGDWGNKDWEDSQTVTRWMQHQPYIHPGQMGVMGGSYGGYMTNWTISHTNDFAGAITDRCVANLVSFGGNHDFAQREDSYWKGVFYGDISQLWANSPIAHFKNVKTPTLVIHSEGDLRCNVEQGEQVFTALQQLGVESRFVRYPQSTSHGMSRGGPPDLRIHRLNEIVSWWSKYLKR